MVREMIKRAFFLSSAGYDIPRTLPAAGRAQAGFIGLHVVVPEFPLLEVAPAEFPVLIRLVDAGKKATALLVLGNVEEKFNDARSVAIKMVFQIHDGTIPIPPDGLFVEQFFRQPLAVENLGMDSNDQHFFVVRTIEDANATALRQETSGAPQKIVFQLLHARMLKTMDLAALRIDAGHHMLDGAVFAGGIHALENNQHSIAVRRIKKILQRAHLHDVHAKYFFVLLL